MRDVEGLRLRLGGLGLRVEGLGLSAPGLESFGFRQQAVSLRVV